MISQAMSMMAALYAAIGPGLILAAALPIFLTALVLVTLASFRRTRRRA